MFFTPTAYICYGGESYMSYEQSRSEVQHSHTLSMENRDKLSLTGVEDVSGFDESLVVLTTSMGELTVRGEGLHIERIDLDSGQLEVRGKVQELSYDESAPKGTLWSRLFGG